MNCDRLPATGPGEPRRLGKEFQKAITLRHLRVIAALADLKLVARVAVALNVTQPAVSKQIAELEKIVGAPIVTRDRNRLYLTPIGNRLADHARQTLNQLDRAAFDIEAMASGVSGSVSIGVVSSVAPSLLPGSIAIFKRSTPQANVTVLEGHFVELFPELEAGAIDLLIARIWQPQELPGIDQMPLFSEPVVVVAGRHHPLAQQNELAWTDVIPFPWILPQANSVARRAVDALFATNGLTAPSNTIASNSLALNLELLRVMPALGLMPLQLAQAQAARGEVTILPLDTQGLLSEARCFWRADQITQNSTLSLFLKCLQQTTAEMQTIPFS
ncbi:LysR substrate-binding domain-containing protein [Pseudosulfitobacter sp. DSM 107133]|uniref:LysR substrate-binding domain-containing protein n=1 Tax=Pseudosulfitobacter sp. DSM 107133 TaxID=2883100 RepID=UPI000DF2F61C|nr:LysR substrate-binding domain-containing protein [Pseudosulfitobacter sp. DSM 107133]UOA30180.1 HTH-type transcriptional regulator GbpR [Pseudosulfitobacter sp. DSM 107133]